MNPQLTKLKSIQQNLKFLQKKNHRHNSTLSSYTFRAPRAGVINQPNPSRRLGKNWETIIIFKIYLDFNVDYSPSHTTFVRPSITCVYGPTFAFDWLPSRAAAGFYCRRFEIALRNASIYLRVWLFVFSVFGCWFWGVREARRAAGGWGLEVEGVGFDNCVFVGGWGLFGGDVFGRVEILKGWVFCEFEVVNMWLG